MMMGFGRIVVWYIWTVSVLVTTLVVIVIIVPSSLAFHQLVVHSSSSSSSLSFDRIGRIVDGVSSYRCVRRSIASSILLSSSSLSSEQRGWQEQEPEQHHDHDQHQHHQSSYSSNLASILSSSSNRNSDEKDDVDDDDDDADEYHQHQRHPSRRQRHRLNKKIGTDNTNTNCLPSFIVAMILGWMPLSSSPCYGGEVGAQITKAVTTSELGLSVRTSVVKGAQFMDRMDGRWERFSDTFQLGTERSKQESKKPPTKLIPHPVPLNRNIGQRILDLSDQVFVQVSGIDSQRLYEQIQRVAILVQPSFERAGMKRIVLEDTTTSTPPTTTTTLNNNNNNNNQVQLLLNNFHDGLQYNYVVYAHYKAYCDLLVQDNIPFGPFRANFEKQLGERLYVASTTTTEGGKGEGPIKAKVMDKSDTTMIILKTPDSANDNFNDRLWTAFQQGDEYCEYLQRNGLISLWERSNSNTNNNNVDVDDDQNVDYTFQDFIEGDVSEYDITIAIDGDITLNTQLLLQEQGYRLYPNFSRYVISYLLNQVVSSSSTTTNNNNNNVGIQQQKKQPPSPQQQIQRRVSVMDYYFDTDYNSDPNKFEVKEVLLSVSIENVL
jgi:hypothetical protein